MHGELSENKGDYMECEPYFQDHQKLPKEKTRMRKEQTHPKRPIEIFHKDFFIAFIE